MDQSAESAYLEYEMGGVARQLALSPLCLIGRSNNSNLILTGDMVSRQHAMLQLSEGGYFYLTDLGSSNGTFVNGTRVTAPVKLFADDEIVIGVHKLTLRQHLEHAAPTAVHTEMQMTSVLVEQKLITVLVVDIRNFTGLAQRVEATLLARTTAALFRESGQMLQERGAWAQKYIGDAVMAVWRHEGMSPQPDELLRILDALDQLARTASGLQSRFELEEPVLIGAGINTGLASVGNVGSAASSDYTALGEVVNKTFRLEAATRTEECDLLIGKDTYCWLAHMPGTAELLQPCLVNLKGYATAETAYRGEIAKIEKFVAARGGL